MKIISLDVEGFLSIGHITLDLQKKGITRIEGINHDSPADSNGSGKSNIFEALYWCLYGSTRKRGISSDEVINRHTKTGAKVTVLFERRGIEYSVTRARKHKESGTGLWLDSNDSGKITDHTKGTMADTQAELEDIIGLSPLAFQKTVFFGQGDVKPIAEMTDAELKTVFEEALGLTQVSLDAQKVVGYRKSIEAQISAKIGARDAQSIMISSVQKNLDDVQGQIVVFSEENDKIVKALYSDIQKEELALSAIEKDVGKIEEDVADMSIRINKGKEAIDRLSSMDASYRSKMKSIDDVISRGEESLSHYADCARELYEEYKKTSGNLGHPCSLCGTTLDKAAIDRAVSEIGTKSYAVMEKKKEAESRVLEAKQEREKMESIYAPFCKKASSVMDNYRKDNARLGELRVSAANKKANMDALEVELRIHRESLTKANESTPTGLIESRDRFSAELEQRNSQVAAFDADLGSLQEEKRIVLMLEDILGNGGLKSLVFDRVTPSINTYANGYMALLDPGVDIEVSTVTTLKSGDMRERFSVSVKSDFGAKNYSGHSGGEKQKVNLSISLAFNRLMRELSGDVPDLLVLDEPFESLDAGSSEQVVEMLGALTSDNIWLITHNQSIKDLLPDSVIIQKKGGISFFE